MRKVVVAMEDYAASDERPLDRCLADVEASDVYIGIFAWRYGFIPPLGNPRNKSITELEYDHALKHQKSCLIFLSHVDAPWLLKHVDMVTGDGKSGRQMENLRKRLSTECLCKFFMDDNELGLSVSTAVATWQEHQLTANKTNHEERRLLSLYQKMPWRSARDRETAERIEQNLAVGNVKIISRGHDMIGGTFFIVPSVPLFVGRDNINRLVLPGGDLSVSRKHCVFKVRNGVVVLEDTNSKYGTFVNGEKLSGSRELHDGDIIKLGSCRLRFKSLSQG
jgi:FHA domain-containing protein/uncharacterized protein DUF4062